MNDDLARARYERLLVELLKCFPHSIINNSFEFIAEPNTKVNSFFSLRGCKSETDVGCKIIEWLSREACVSEHYASGASNDKVHKYHLSGINEFFKTDFNEVRITNIYEDFGNGIRHNECIKFVETLLIDKENWKIENGFC